MSFALLQAMGLGQFSGMYSVRNGIGRIFIKIFFDDFVVLCKDASMIFVG
jgi:hypothetical protein